jgi:hypothetical protein
MALCLPLSSLCLFLCASRCFGRLAPSLLLGSTCRLRGGLSGGVRL